jgi:hypothetical protein
MQLSPFCSGYREDVKATSMVVVLSTAEAAPRRQSQSGNAASAFVPQLRSPIDMGRDSKTRLKNTTQNGWAMTEKSDRLARAREEIAARVASFKATQEKFEREREEYFVTTLEKARNGSAGKAFWS